MPLYYFACVNWVKHGVPCPLIKRLILTPEEAAGISSVLCSCGGIMHRSPQPPSSRVTETLDNGAMTKRLERLADAERLFEERNDAVKKSQGS